MNKKADILNNILIVLVMVVVVIFIVALFSLGSILFPILAGEGAESARIIQESIQATGNSGLTNASSVATETTINVLGTIELLVYFFFFGLIMGFMITAYYVRTYPFLAFVWVGFMFIVVIISMFLSNAYELSRDSSQLTDYYTTWGTNDFLMSYLPHVMAVVMIIGGIVLFGLISTGDSEQESRII